MLHAGENLVNGVPVDVERKSIRRINLRVRPDGRVHLSVPNRWATLREGEAFLLSKWDWVIATRAQILARPAPVVRAVTPEERSRLIALLTELMSIWTTRTHEACVTWKLREMKTLWGSCHIRNRLITFNLRLAHAAPEQVEYVVVHELTHLKVADHSARFHQLMDLRLPNWRLLKRALNRT